MKRIKKTKWDKNLKEIRRIQNMARDTINELETTGGFSTSTRQKEYLLDLVNRDYTKPSATTVKDIRRALNTNRIYDMYAYTDISGIRINPRVKATRTPEMREIYIAARQYNWAATEQNKIEAQKLKKPTTFGGNYGTIAQAAYRQIVLQSGVKFLVDDKGRPAPKNLSFRQLYKYQIEWSKYMEAYDKLTNKIGEQAARAMLRAMGSPSETIAGKWSPVSGSKAAYNAYQNEKIERSKRVFGTNHDKIDADRMYDFFDNSLAWARFRREMRYDEETLEKIEDALANNVSITEIDAILNKARSASELKRELSELIKRKVGHDI